MLNVEVIKCHFVSTFLLKFIGNNCLGNGIVKPLLSTEWLEEVEGKELQKVICWCVNTWTFSDKTIFCMFTCILFCCVNSVYNGQMSPTFATSSL